MIRTLALLFAIAVVLASLLVLSWNRGEPEVPVSESAGGAFARPAATDVDAGGSETTPAVVGANAPRVEVTEEADSTRVPIPEDYVWRDVRVVDADSKAPVPGALVRWGTSFSWQAMNRLPEREQERLSGDLELKTERCGWQTRTNAAGVARIAESKLGAWVFAYADGRYGFAWVVGKRKEADGVWQLELEADRTLRARVLDVNQRPAIDVEVGIVLFDADGTPRPNPHQIQPAMSTAPEGVVEFRHVQTWLVGMRGEKAGSTAYRVAMRVPGHDDPGVAFDLEALPAEPIVLRLPATGKLRARMLHAGQALVAGVTFKVWEGADDDRAKSNWARDVAVDDDGWARFPHVGLGGTLTVLGTRIIGRIQAEVAGPVAHGQEVSIELDAGSIFSLVGTLLGPDGLPLADAALSARYVTDGMSGGAGVKTDAQGRFLWLLTQGKVDRMALRELIFTQQPADGSPLRVSVPQRELTRGVTDLGVLQLTPGAIVVAGRVVYDAPPQRQATFAVEALSDKRKPNGEEHWQQLTGLAISMRPDGTFEVQGETRPVRHRLAFAGRDHLPIAPIEFRVGADDVVVRLSTGNGIAAKVLVPDGMHSNPVLGVLVPQSQAPAETNGELRTWRDRYASAPHGVARGIAHLDWRALPSGTYRLEIRIDGLQNPLAVIDDVILPQPEGGDPRLQGIDVRDVVRVASFAPRALTDGNAGSPSSFTLFLLPQDDEKGWVGTPLPAAGGTMLLPTTQVELLVTSPGFRSKRVRCDATDVRLALEPWPTVEVTIADLPPLPKGVGLHLWLRSANGPNQKSVRYRSAFRSGALSDLLEPEGRGVLVQDGRARLPIGDGALRVGGYLKSEASRAIQSLRTWTPSEIDGAANGGAVTVQLSADELQQAIAALER